MNNVYISDEVISGTPYMIEVALQRELANQILNMNNNNIENVIDNMRLYADVFEILEKHINDEFITLKFNPMGSWYKCDDEEKEM